MLSSKQKNNLQIAYHAYDCGVNYVSQLYGISKGKLYYWIRYIKNSQIPNPHGGTKNFKFNNEERYVL